MALFASTLFVIAYVLISAEHKLKISKSAIALLFGGLLWVLIAINDPINMPAHLNKVGEEIFGIVVFLLSAMALVEILVHYRFFDLIRTWLLAKKLNNTQQLWLISSLAFISSPIIDNLTTSVVFSQLSRLFFKGKNLIVAVSLVVISANAGGAFSPIGDVTTTMLWLKGKFSSSDVILYGFAPSLTIYLIAAVLITKKISKGSEHAPKFENIKLLFSEKVVIGFTLGSFSLPFIFHSFGLKPYMGLLTGLGFTWILIDLLKIKLPNHQSHFTASIEHLLQRVDISSLKFFIGILLAVAALDHFGILKSLSDSLFGSNPSLQRYIIGNSVMGLLSAVVDNVPLTAAAMNIINTSEPSIWVLAAITLGTGGSLLLVGSAAGIIAMGIVKDLNFSNYLKVATLPATVGYVCGIAVWYLEYLLR